MTTDMPTTHHGRNIKRLREMFGMKQEALAITLGEDWTQKKVSRLEDKAEVDDAMLAEVAKALKVTPEAIKNFDEQAVFNNISNSFHDHAMLVNYQFNPIEKIVQLYDEKVELLERLLQSEKEKVQMLEKIVSGN